MKTISRYLISIAFLLHTSILYSQWRFSVIVGISQATVSQYGGFQSTKFLVLQQFETINARFNHNNVFKKIFEFAVDSIYQFNGYPENEIFVAHPNFAFRVVYDAFPIQGGGWYGPPTNAIHHSWSWDSFDGIFGPYATDGITHEFGHARGAIDLYGIQVRAKNNPINGQAYNEATSIMNYPYGESIWDIHSNSLIDRNAAMVYPNSDYISSAFPGSISIKVLDSEGQFVPYTDLKLYPINWYSDSVATVPLFAVTTNAQGEYVFTDNPFGPYSPGYPWDIRYPNFLVAAKINGIANFKFMPLTAIQNSYFTNPSAAYRLTFGDYATSTSTTEKSQSSGFILYPNYPNPFNSSTNISFYNPKQSFISLKIFDFFGREAATLVSEELSEGEHSRQWDANGLPGGVYFYRLQAGSITETKKLILLR